MVNNKTIHLELTFASVSFRCPFGDPIRTCLARIPLRGNWARRCLFYRSPSLAGGPNPSLANPGLYLLLDKCVSAARSILY